MIILSGVGVEVRATQKHCVYRQLIMSKKTLSAGVIMSSSMSRIPWRTPSAYSSKHWVTHNIAESTHNKLRAEPREAVQQDQQIILEGYSSSWKEGWACGGLGEACERHLQRPNVTREPGLVIIKHPDICIVLILLMKNTAELLWVVLHSMSTRE